MAAYQPISTRRVRPPLERLAADHVRLPQPFVAPDGEPCYRVGLTRGKFALIDERDVGLISRYLWHSFQTPCGMSYARTGIVMMHRLLVGVDGKIVDHKNRDGLDNRRINLRPCNYMQNAGNLRKPSHRPMSSRFKGVYFYKNRWCATISIGNKMKYLGRFETALRAALVYDAAAIQRHGEFERLNFPEFARRK